MKYIYIYFLLNLSGYQPYQWMMNSAQFLLRILLFSEIIYDAFLFTHIPTYAELQWAFSWKWRTPAREDLGSINISGI